MSKLYVSARSDGRKTETARSGNKTLLTHARGWGAGVYVVSHFYKETGRLSFWIYKTKGSEVDEDGEIVENLGDMELIHAFTT